MYNVRSIVIDAICWDHCTHSRLDHHDENHLTYIYTVYTQYSSTRSNTKVTKCEITQCRESNFNVFKILKKQFIQKRQNQT